MTTDPGILERVDGAPSPEDVEPTQLRASARELERAGDWAGALAAYERLLAHAERSTVDPDPRLFIKLGDLLIKTDCPSVAIAMFERAASHFAASGSHTSVIALCIKVVRTDRHRTDVYVRFAKLLLQHGYVEEARLVLVDYAERAWARATLRTLARLERAPADERLRTLRRLIQAVEESFASEESQGETTGQIAARSVIPHPTTDGASEPERHDEPHDRAAFDAIRPRHRGLWPTLPEQGAPLTGVSGPNSPWPRAAALSAGEGSALMRPDRLLARPTFGHTLRFVAREMLGTIASGIQRGARTVRALKVPSWVVAPAPRWAQVAVALASIGVLGGPPIYRTLTQIGAAGDLPPTVAENTSNAVAAAPVPPTPRPVYTAGGFRAIQDTTIAPLVWDASLIEVPLIAEPSINEASAFPAADSLPPLPE